jgi:ketosteroid isomerase-like protein
MNSTYRWIDLPTRLLTVALFISGVDKLVDSGALEAYMRAWVLAKSGDNWRIQMKQRALIAYIATVMVAALLALVSSVPLSAAEEENIPYSSDPAVRAEQHTVYDVVNRYQEALNSKDTGAIVGLFADDSVAEWNNKRTYATHAEKVVGYDALFRIANFTTHFAYDAINVYGDTAVVRTHHHVGAAVIENGKKVTDYNREVFVLRKIDGTWKIVLYTFNTDPKQGEG